MDLLFLYLSYNQGYSLYISDAALEGIYKVDPHQEAKLRSIDKEIVACAQHNQINDIPELFLKKEGIEKAISKTRESFQTLKLSILEHKKLLTTKVYSEEDNS